MNIMTHCIICKEWVNRDICLVCSDEIGKYMENAWARGLCTRDNAFYILVNSPFFKHIDSKIIEEFRDFIERFAFAVSKTEFQTEEASLNARRKTLD